MAELDARRAEVLSSAAKTIQRRIRTHIARKQFIALRKATIIVQSIWRGGQSDIYDCINQFYNYMQCCSWRLI
jgi:myosin heavy subunit